MTHELRLERLFDAPLEVVFDAFVDPDAQDEIFSEAGIPEGYRLLQFDIDLRVGGNWVIVVGPEKGVPDRITRVFTEVDRPRQLGYRESMFIGEWERTVESNVEMTFEAQDGKTLFTYLQSGFESAEVRDSFLEGVPGYLDAVGAFAAARARGGSGTGGAPGIVEGG